MSDNKTIQITIMEREFTVSCTPEERPGLINAVNFLDKKMRDIRDTGKFIGVERIAVMAALNLSYDLLNSKSGNLNIGDYKRRMSYMQDQIDKACNS